MSEAFKAACLQMNSGDDVAQNIEAATYLIHQAAEAGADFILLPENAFYMRGGGEPYPADTTENHAGVIACMKLAQKLGKYILIGSIAVRAADGGKLLNRSVLINADGEIAAVYDKIHLFDVTLPGGEKYNESERFQHGSEVITANLPWGVLAFSICYDVRFPYLYRHMAVRGADFFAIPAAFTRTTGTADWHVLLRARAIENGAYVFAPAQSGEHPGNRQTYGHALIVDPWGDIIAEHKEGIGFAIASINPDLVERVRQSLPSLQHTRDI